MVKSRSRASGFSLVELLVAVAFTLVLMAGMATVFKASLGTFFTSGELLASSRRNRMSIELLGDDLNTAEMFLLNLADGPAFMQDLPPFCVLPNMPIAGAGTDDPQVTDELYFYRDLPLPFDGTLVAAAAQKSAAQAVQSGVDPTTLDYHFTINVTNATYAKQVKKGMNFIFKDFWDTAYVGEDPVAADTQVTVLAGPDPHVGVTGSGSTGLPLPSKHLDKAGIVFVNAAQIVRYRVEMVKLDPAAAAGVPCLVRDQGLYWGQQPFTAGAAFVTTEPQQVITDNLGIFQDPADDPKTVTPYKCFKIYLSTNSGTDWAGHDLAQGKDTTGYTDGWTGGIIAALETQLSATKGGRPGVTTTKNNDIWFRSIPTLVRVDIGTRTASQRSDYIVPDPAHPEKIGYKTMVRSLVFVPRHSGLPLK
jgi:hypothetical protein